MRRMIALVVICALCVGLLAYNLVGFHAPTAQSDGVTPTRTTGLSSEGDLESQEPPSSVGQVRILNTNSEQQKAWEKIAESYQKATGVTVELLDGSDDRQPTLCTLTAAEDLDSAVYQDLAGTAAYAQLADMGMTLTLDGKVYGIAAQVECFGLIYNQTLLAEVATPEEICDIHSFAAVIQSISQKGYTAFAGRGLSDGVAARLASLPGNYQSFAKIWVENAAKDTEGDALERFLAGESVFYLGSTDEYDALSAAGIQHLGILPVYLDDQLPQMQSLCVTVQEYWCVRADAASADVEATLAFLDFLLTSTDGGQPPVDQLKLLSPYRQATYCANPLEQVLRTDVATGKRLLICQPVERVPEEFLEALAAYAQKPTNKNWDQVEASLQK